MKQMLAVLRTTLTVTVHLHSNHMLWRTHRRRGQGQVFVDATTIRIYLEFDSSHRTEPLLQLGALAHELAHAVEIACLPPVARLEDMWTLLRDRGGPWRESATGRIVETPFAEQAEHRVLFEASTDQRVGGQLAELASRHQLRASCRCRAPVSVSRGPVGLGRAADREPHRYPNSGTHLIRLTTRVRAFPA
ncbi:MAG: hypothetical protein ACRD26_15920 [Vicinamibacterales bacterium]